VREDFCILKVPFIPYKWRMWKVNCRDELLWLASLLIAHSLLVQAIITESIENYIVSGIRTIIYNILFEVSFARGLVGIIQIVMRIHSPELGRFERCNEERLFFEKYLYDRKYRCPHYIYTFPLRRQFKKCFVFCICFTTENVLVRNVIAYQAFLLSKDRLI